MIAVITNRDLALAILILAVVATIAIYMLNDLCAPRAKQIGTEGGAADSLGFDGTAKLTALGADDSLEDAA